MFWWGIHAGWCLLERLNERVVRMWSSWGFLVYFWKSKFGLAVVISNSENWTVKWCIDLPYDSVKLSIGRHNLISKQFLSKIWHPNALSFQHTFPHLQKLPFSSMYHIELISFFNISLNPSRSFKLWHIYCIECSCFTVRSEFFE